MHDKRRFDVMALWFRFIAKWPDISSFIVMFIIYHFIKWRTGLQNGAPTIPQMYYRSAIHDGSIAMFQTRNVFNPLLEFVMEVSLLG